MPVRKKAKISHASTPKISKTAPVTNLVDTTKVTKTDVADVFLRFSDWPEAAVIKAINSSDWAKVVAKMDLTNVVELNAVATAFAPYKLMSYLKASRGRKNKVRCTKCRLRKGPYKRYECRDVPVPGKVMHGGACAACGWSNENRKCELCDQFNGVLYGSRKDHLETHRRMMGYDENPNIDEEVSTISAEELGDNVPGGFEMVGGVCVPVGLSFEQKLSAVTDALIDLRIENKSEALRIPGEILARDLKVFEEWAADNDYIEEDNPE